ncbi:lens fiber major intrinsic protein-like [Engraulis encrasicolus]|uniref:lens fiber major intrinsic protein-like n=1 Tax=Engraulis encrasicolus TaxID=184585 RepID=UPI002FD2C1EB
MSAEISSPDGCATPRSSGSCRGRLCLGTSLIDSLHGSSQRWIRVPVWHQHRHGHHMQLVTCIFSVMDERRNGHIGSTPMAISFCHHGTSHGNVLHWSWNEPCQTLSLFIRNFMNHWVYWAGPKIGGAMCCIMYDFMFFPCMHGLAEGLATLKGSRSQEVNQQDIKLKTHVL